MDWRLKSALAAAGLAPPSSPACGSAPALRRRTKLLFTRISRSRFRIRIEVMQQYPKWPELWIRIRKLSDLLDPDPFIIKQKK
jgi:hypothetical protein